MATQNKKNKKKQQNSRKRALTLVSVLGAVAAAVLLTAAIYIFSLTRSLPGIEELENPNPELASLVYSRDGKLLHKYFLKNRTYVPLDSISQYVPQALISTEDLAFYDHWGLDVRRFVLAMAENLIRGRERWHGASTITQQLAKNLFLTQERTINRKVKEFFTAVELEKTYTKDEILALYLNTVYFGSGAYGIEAAAWTYFNKPASELNLQESATLVGILKSPVAYDPSRNPENSKSRRNLILSLMKKEGAITPEQAERAMQSDIVLTYTPVTNHGLAPYFTEYIRQNLKPFSRDHDINVYRDGLRIQTTLDSRMQQYAEEAVSEHIAWVQERFDKAWKWPADLKNQFIRETSRYRDLIDKGMKGEDALKQLKADKAWVNNLLHDKTRVQVAFVALEPSTGHILAWVGGNDFSPGEYQYQFDHVWQAHRQPGSTFKPFVYTAAIDKGIPPTYQILDQPLAIEAGDEVWIARNSDKKSGGLTPLRTALSKSVNQVTVRLLHEFLTPSEVIRYAKRMGIRSDLAPNMSIALGTSEVNPLELASAFGTFANNGVWVEPNAITRIEDRFRHTVSEVEPASRTALDSTTNYVMVSMLQDVIKRGTGRAIPYRYGLRMEAGGKTGTTQNLKDAWFVGFTPQIVGVAWAGFDDERIAFTSMSYGQGARAALPIWAKFMKKCYADSTLGMENQYFHMPDNIIAVPVSRTTNRPAQLFTDDVYMEYFTPKGFKKYQTQLARPAEESFLPADPGIDNGLQQTAQPYNTQ
ncbi:PBP1A family penicillin-binding protein [Prosthecochloris sp. N3]|uniref:PBP1A family penicillin-binding protein n=1 Tax=Prosthecochloris ethylica TaxID=2743976 RepID=A0ABR9XS09_9CHLB|nr:PBP1A family penicillin-binding protein [Prosthecochloris ethylica]MBF0586919.1 PBP1A family penicillin-binding protein [Prosthecochloris ethylica]MBF0636733.1 PBP1A family penicillin-binding protein [Prosthecochloris ethylica]NUK48409.1 PBP1A family penicillin-binding protein [Prosthecochloris ethylica]